MFKLKKQYLAGVFGLLLSQASFAQLTGGGLQNIGNPGPSQTLLNLLYPAMNAALDIVAEYVSAHNKCPPANFFSKQGNNISIFNGPNCDMLAQFNGRNLPGALQGKTIRIVIKIDQGQTPTAADFVFRKIITNIDYGPTGSDANILLVQPPPYTWSHTLQGTSFGNVASAALVNVLNDSYNTVDSSSSSANGTSSTGGGSTQTNIGTVF